MKRILHISKFYPPYRGGIEDICASIVKVSTNYNQRLICFNSTCNNEISYDQTAIIERIGIWRNIQRQPVSFSYFRHLRTVINDFNPEIIHFHAPNPLISLYLLILLPVASKLIVHWHSDIIEQQGLFYKLYKPIETRLLQRANKVIITSPKYLEKSVTLSKITLKTEVIPNVIDINKFDVNEEILTQVQNIRSQYLSKKIIFFVGRHVPYKGIEYLLQAEKYIDPEAIILIAGTGSLTKKLKADYASDRIIWLGRISDDELRNYLYAANIFAFPSITRNEAFGVALAEAMYCQATPVTFTIDGSGVNWVSIKNETGLEVENRNEKAYAAAINELLKNDAKCTLLGENARKRVIENFTIDCIKSKLLQLYETI
jgi:glycosyltransferase involved in cell wall biosynthesis